MPELPEVETVRRTLAPAIGMRVTAVWTSGMPLRLNQPVEQDMLHEAGYRRRIEEVRRLGKYLIIDFVDGPLSVLVHLGMSGRLRLVKRAEARAPHTHVEWRLSGGRGVARDLRYSDPRRFGQVSWLRRGAEREHPALAKLG
ncbi:MAG: DNA-formamidopyrimidine glycosylase family protein, partial [Myxococcota bacterium]